MTEDTWWTRHPVYSGILRGLFFSLPSIGFWIRFGSGWYFVLTGAILVPLGVAVDVLRSKGRSPKPYWDQNPRT